MTTFRTDDVTRWGSGKGSNLTNVEVDLNFWDLVQRMIAQEARPDPSAGIDHFEVVGGSFYVHMTDDTTILGPYTLPMALYYATGAWQPSFAYSRMDTFTEGGGLYVVNIPHTSENVFDPGANNGVDDYYTLMIQTPGSSLPAGGATGMMLKKSTSDDYAVTWGWPLPIDGTARKYLIKQSSTNQDADWDTPHASDIAFTPATGSDLVSTNLADAVEEAAESVGSAEDIEYVPSTGSGLTDDNVKDALDTLGSQSPIGRQTMWVPASAMIAQITDGPADGVVETATHNIMLKTLDFDDSTQEYAQFSVAMPKSWDESGVYFRVFWSHDTTTVNFGVTWSLEARSVIDGSVFDSAFDTPTTLTDTGATADISYVSDESDAVVVSGLMTYPNTVLFRMSRVPADGSDTLAVDARLHGIQLFYNTDASTDD